MGKFFTAIIILALFLSTITQAATYSGGSGTAADPYKINSNADLLTLAATTADYSKYFILTANINMYSAYFSTAIIAPDTSTATDGFQGTKFTGNFDGNGHTISNLYINAGYHDYIGLFGYIDSGGKVSNLGLKDVTIIGSEYIGGLCGCNDYGIFNQCYATGTVTGQIGSFYAGGLCGDNNYGAFIYCYATSTVNGDACAGGLCGSNYYGTISQCYATGAVTGSSFSVGGLCGVNHSGNINCCYATGVVTGSSSAVGGLCGYNDYGSINQCYAAGKVTGSSYSVGGLCGSNYYGTISQCYATGAVTGSSNVGGLCGSQYGNSAKTENSFWDVVTSGLTVGYNLEPSSPGIITNVFGKTTAQMQTVLTYTDAGWDFSNTDGDAADWILSGVQYPRLICGLTAAVPDTVGMTKEDAKAALVTANFQAAIIYTVNDTIPAGRVISQSLAAGIEIPCGTKITLVVSTGSRYAGSGTSLDPYQIATKYQLLLLSQTPADYGSYFVLTADIDLAGETFNSAVIAPDTMISDSFNGTKFAGNFDGRGHIISNLHIDAAESYYVGLFGYITGYGQVCNLGLENVTVTGYCYVGGLCGYNSGTISQCFAVGAVTGSFSVGGLCGYNSYGVISQCYATGAVMGSSYVGGLCGYNSYGVMSQCYANATVTGSSSIGGLCGKNSDSTINQCYATGSVSGSSSVGGLCGYNYSYSTIYQCYAAGTVTASSSTVGGLCGSNGGTVRNCFWDIEASGQAVSAGGAGKTTAQMQIFSTFTDAGWDFSNDDGDVADWTLSGVQYPHLISEIKAVIPDVIGMMRQDARVALAAVNFQAVMIYVASDTVAAGQVISQSPAAGFEIPCGAMITLAVSGGAKYPGSGTAADPYRIAAKYELLILSSTTTDYNKYFILTSDIDLAGEMFTAAVIAPNRRPGDRFNGTKFTGKLNGNGHVISNLHIDAVDGYYVGLFGYLDTGNQITNLGLESVDVTGYYYVGGLCGFESNGTLSQCSVSGSLTGSSYVGGLCGYAWGTINQCSAAGSAIGSSYIGGLCGYNMGRINQCSAAGSVAGSLYTGGLCGRNGSGNAVVNQCYSAAKVVGGDYAGGLCGANTSYVSLCYATGTVTGNSRVGGLCGSNYDDDFGKGSPTLSQCYAASAVTGNSYVGGLCGNHAGRSAKIENSFWDTETSGLTVGYNLDSISPGTITNVVGKTTAQMHTLSTFTNASWDFVGETANGTNDYWWMRCEGMSYPRLSGLPLLGGDFECPDGVDLQDLTVFIENWLGVWQVDADIVDDSIVNMLDLSVISQNWMQTECGDCGGADVTGDGNVDIQDVVIFADQWLFEENPDCQIADIDNDGTIDLADLSILAANWMRE